MDNNFIIIAVYVLLGTLVLGLVAFVITYMIGSDWRKSRVGRYMMYFMITITGTFAYILAGPLIREVPGRRVVDLAILVLLNIVAWRLTWLLRNIQKGKFDESKMEDDIQKDIQ